MAGADWLEAGAATVVAASADEALLGTSWKTPPAVVVGFCSTTVVGAATRVGAAWLVEVEEEVEEDDDEDEDDDEAGLLLVVSGMSTTVPSPPVPARTVLPVPYWMSTTGLGRESLVVSPRVFLQLGWLLTSRSSLHDSSKPRVQMASQML